MEGDKSIMDEAAELARSRVEDGINEDEFVSFRSSGEIGVSKAVMQQYFSGVDRVEVRFNLDDDLMCFVPSSDPDVSYSLIEDSGSGRISAEMVLERLGLWPEEGESERYAVANAGKYVFVFLDKPL